MPWVAAALCFPLFPAYQRTACIQGECVLFESTARLQELQSLLGSPMLEGYLRPGCTHLTLEALLQVGVCASGRELDAGVCGHVSGKPAACQLCTLLVHACSDPILPAAETLSFQTSCLQDEELLAAWQPCLALPIVSRHSVAPCPCPLPAGRAAAGGAAQHGSGRRGDAPAPDHQRSGPPATRRTRAGGFVDSRAGQLMVTTACPIQQGAATIAGTHPQCESFA